VNLDSGNYILPSCKAYIEASGALSGNPQSTFGQGLCLGTIEAVGSMAAHSVVDVEDLSTEGLLLVVNMYDRAPTWNGRVCTPPGVTRGQLVRVVVAYVEARPRRMHEPFWQLTYEALVDAWPCNKAP
jgi:hypothetical protein